MKTKFILPLAAVGFTAGLLAVTGCKTSVNSGEPAPKTGQPSTVADHPATTDRSLKQKVSIVTINPSMTPGGFLQVQIELLNTTHSRARFSYHFEWFDANGMQIGTLMSAEVAEVIEGGEDKFVSAVAPTPACRDFRVKFIEN